ncbi:MAG TPA: histidine phosphatase family protein [Anaerolineaceae bacterium]|nr:histidine phosphatase family protein [Anaerolineaceae bacterium]
MEILETTLQGLSSAPLNQPVSVLLRHSTRYPILDISKTLEVGLTPDGRILAEQFGDILTQRFTPGRIASSPVERCIDTAKAILRGANWHADISIDERIGHPYIDAAWTSYPYRRPGEIMPSSVADVIKFILPYQTSGCSLNIFISHDTVVGCVVEYLLGEQITEENWPAFLEGLVLWQNPEGISLAWRGAIHEIGKYAIQ